MKITLKLKGFTRNSHVFWSAYMAVFAVTNLYWTHTEHSSRIVFAVLALICTAYAVFHAWAAITFNARKAAKDV